MSEPSSSEELIRKHLVVDESAIFEELVQRAKRFLILDNRGRVHVRGTRGAHGGRRLVLIFLVGRKLAFLGKLIPKDSSGVTEIAEFAGIDADVASARLSGLRAEGNVEPVSRGQWRIVYARVPEILESLESGQATNE